MPRPCATEASEARVALLVDMLFARVGDDGKTIADVAREAGLEHETVRRLCRNPGGGYRTSPGFFVVAALARARGLSLDWLAAETLDYASEPWQP
ncbi:MAG: XRE family transcriptional regulator [Ilumatobacteraceae bacterium]